MQKIVAACLILVMTVCVTACGNSVESVKAPTLAELVDTINNNKTMNEFAKEGIDIVAKSTGNLLTLSCVYDGSGPQGRKSMTTFSMSKQGNKLSGSVKIDSSNDLMNFEAFIVKSVLGIVVVYAVAAEQGTDVNMGMGTAMDTASGDIEKYTLEDNGFEYDMDYKTGNLTLTIDLSARISFEVGD